MLKTPDFPSFEAAYAAVLERLCTQDEFRNSPRGNASRECLGLSFKIARPRERLIYIAARRANPIFHFADALWHLSGRNDLPMIAYYAPRMRQGSTDGLTLRGSAHGSRVFAPPAGDATTPFDRALNLLRTEADSKRAVLPIFEGSELAAPENPDVSCTVALHLLAREGKLHMVCYQRASDADRGLLADVFSYTMIQEFAAHQLDLDLGQYIHHVGSLHLAAADLARAERSLTEVAAGGAHEQQRPCFPAMPGDTTHDTVADVLKHEELLRLNEVRYGPDEVIRTGLAPYWQQVLLLFEVQRQLSHTRGPVSRESLEALDPALARLTELRWPRRMPYTVGAPR